MTIRTLWLASAALAAVMAAAPAGARTRVAEAVAPRTAGEPILAIVSLASQRITVYDAQGWILRAPVSSGERGRETPSGVFSIIQKNAEHYSNLYDDAYMPHMQRITWSGIAMHGGVVPGHPASHGCVRLPFGFAEQLFGETKMGMRVIVAPRDAEPHEIAHPLLFSAKSGAGAIAAARAAEAAEAGKRANEARTAALAASRDVAKASVPVRVAENLKARAEAELAAADAAAGSAATPEAKQQAEAAKAKLTARVAELEAQLAAAKAELQPKLDAVAPARETVLAAEAARGAAAQAAAEAARDLDPVSVFVSRKSQKIYVRRGFQPILDAAVTIADAEQPIGTHVFTAVSRGNGDALTWNAVTLDGGPAKAALDRISIPDDVKERLVSMGAPRSSLIVSDEELSRETGKDTDFIIVLSNEPQGGIKNRPRPSRDRYDRWAPPGSVDARYDRRMPAWRPPIGGPSFFSYR